MLLDFLNKNLGLVSLVVGAFAYIVYWKQQQDNKRDAAKIILQEIRRAEDIIYDYKENGNYKFTKKIISTNSWAKNIHHFVGNLDADELDKISNLYSTGEYLDSIITKVSDSNFDESVKQYQSIINPNPTSTPAVTQTPVVNIAQSQQVVITQIVPPWKSLLDQITFKHEMIYHSTIIEKLKKIAKQK